MKILSAFLKITDRTNDFIGNIMWVGVLLNAIIILYEVACRYFFNSPNVWTNELCQYIFAAYTVLTGGHLMRNNAHINVDILYTRFPPRMKNISNVFTFPFFLLFSGALFIVGIDFGWESLSQFEHSGSAWDPPIFLVKIMLPIGALLLLLQGFVQLIRNIQALISGENVERIKKAREAKK